MTLFTREGGTPGQPTVLLLHGASVSSWMWSDTLDSLADLHTLAPDLPGLGKNAPMGRFNLNGAADQLAAFIRAQATGQQAHVVGHSLGGAVAAQLLARHPEVVRSAVLMGVTAEPLPFERTFVAFTLALSAATRSRRLLNWQAKALGIPEVHRAQFMAEGLAQTRPGLENVLKEAMAFRVPPVFAQVTVPVLTLVGAREGGINHRSARALAQPVPGGQAYEVPRAGHAWMATQPDLFHAILRAWVAQAPLPDTLRPLLPSRTPQQPTVPACQMRRQHL
ncbi:alpha/beta fold hydrolase [Deinococcus hohokamensis]|uniref:Alpha/beta fold hydrolase n=1 Tax=Deinococcus hohokamensis TaxID=309883 RepID=A0ABV9I8K3_9DEIO